MWLINEFLATFPFTQKMEEILINLLGDTIEKIEKEGWLSQLIKSYPSESTLEYFIEKIRDTNINKSYQEKTFYLIEMNIRWKQKCEYVIGCFYK